MTKKSATRIQRDVVKKQASEYFQKNTVFDELNQIHQKLTEQIQTFGTISVLANDRQLCSYLNSATNIEQKIRLLSVDLKKVIADINTNYALHKDQTGGAKDPDAHMQALTIFQNYMQITSVIEGVIFPTAGSILEEFGAAEILMKQAQEKEKTANTVDSLKPTEENVE